MNSVTVKMMYNTNYNVNSNNKNKGVLIITGRSILIYIATKTTIIYSLTLRLSLRKYHLV